MAQQAEKRNRITLLLAVVIAAALLFVWMGANQDDYYRKAILPDEFAANASGAVFTGERLMLEAGSYTFTIAYTAQGEATAEIINDLAADEQGLPSPVLASVALNTNQTEATLNLTVDQAIRGIRVVLRGDVQPGTTNVLSDQRVWNDTAFFMLLVLLSGGVCVWLTYHKKKNERLPEGLVWAVCGIAGVFASLPVLRDFFIYGHDLAFHLTRIESIKDGLLSGQFPVRLDTTFLNGYGYISSMMYGELLLYIPALLRLCGVSMMVSYQAFVVGLNVLTAYLTYRAVKSLTGKPAVGLIAGVVYTLGIYRLMTLYTRAAAGEAMAMLFYPLVIVGIIQVVSQGKGLQWLVIGMTGMLQTHLISLEIAAIGCALYTLYAIMFRKTTWKHLLRLCAAAGIVVLINLWFLVPFLRFSQLKLDIFTQEKQIWLYAAYLPQLFASFVDPYIGMTTFPGTTVEMPLSVGLLLGLGLVLLVFAAFQKREDQLADTELFSIGRGTAVFGILALVMASVVFPWTYVHKIPILGKILFAAQFPWRYLGAASALLAIVFAVSAVLLVPKPTHRRLLVLGCLLLAILNAAPFIDAAVQSDQQIVIIEDKYTDFVEKAYLPGDYYFEDTDVNAYLNRAPVPEAVSGEAVFSGYQRDGLNLSFSYAAAEDVTVALPLYGYPLYTAIRNGREELTLTDGNNHILTTLLPAGSGHVEITFALPWHFTLADIVSLVSVLGLVVLYFLKRRTRYTQTSRA